MKTYFRFIILGVFSYFLACNSSTSSINPENSKVKDLFGQKWALYSFRSEDGNKINLNPNETYNIVFAQNDTLNGKADCNTYFSEYNAKDGGEIKIEPCIGTTYVYCGEESHIDKYYEALVSTNIYEVNSLILKLGFGSKGILHFIRQ